MFNIVISGAPGSGKGTIGKLIAAKFGLEHVSTGDMLRSEIAAGSEIGLMADELISAGNLVPDQMITDMLRKKIVGTPTVRGFIFDGYPRTLEQAKLLKELLSDLGEQVDLMIDLVVEEATLISRLLERGLTSGRADDNADTIAKRLELFHEKTEPVLSYYKAEKALHKVSNDSTIEESLAAASALIEEFMLNK